MQIGEAAVLGDYGSCRLVETCLTRMVAQVVLMKKVRKTAVWMVKGRVLRRRVQSEGVWARVKAGTRIGAWVYVLSYRIRIRITKHHLPWIPTLLVLVGTHVLLELALLLLIGGEIRNTLGAPGPDMSSR